MKNNDSNKLKQEIRNKKIVKLSNEELKQVSGGTYPSITNEEAKTIEKITSDIQDKYENW